MTTENTTVTFDFTALNVGIAALVQLKKDNKAKRDALRQAESRMELNVMFPAMEYAAATFDLQPLARFVSLAKPSPIAKRAIKAIFSQFEYALIGEEKRAGFVFVGGKEGKVFDAAKLAILRDAFNAGDSFLCDQVKSAFPTPDMVKGEKLAKLGDALAKRMKADGFSKQDLFDLIKAL
jgi:hypothetical protein